MIRVRKDNPCPVCKSGDWCLIAEDGTACICARISDGGTVVGDKGAGWLHRLSDTPIPKKDRPKRFKVDTAPPPDWNKLVYGAQANSEAHLQRLSQEIGISVASLMRLDVGHDGKNYTFPMRDGKFNFAGIRLRSKTGKFAVKGSKNALFIPRGVSPESNNLLFICEGPTDTGALLDLGFDAIGRASCGTGKSYILDMIGDKDRQVIIMADKDEPKKLPNGQISYPGIEGALRLAADLKDVVRTVRCVKPPKAKDMRKWYQDGATATQVMLLVQNARFL